MGGEENVEIIRRGYERLANEGYESIFEIMHPDFEMTTPPGLTIEPATYRGEEGIRYYFESFFEVMDEVNFIAEEFILEGEQVVVPSILRARAKTSGIEVDQKAVLAWRLKDGKVIEVQAFATRDEALAAAAAG